MGNALVNIEKGSELTALSTQKGIDSLLKRAKDAVKNSDGGNLETKVGRAKIRSNAFQATKLKTLMEKEASKLIAGIEENIAPELEKIVNIKKYSKELGLGLDKVRADTNAEVKAVEDKLQLIEDEKIKQVELKELAIKKENDHEIGLLLNEKLDRDAAELKIKLEADKKAEDERLEKERIDREEKLKIQAAKEATEKAERLAKEERERVEKEKQKLINDAAAAEREKIAAQEREKLATEQAERNRIYLEEKAKQDAIDAENNRLDGIKNAKKDADNAEKKRLADVEQAKQDEILRQQEKIRITNEETRKREANKQYRAKVHRGILAVLIKNGISEDDGKTMIKLAAKGLLPQLSINY